MPNLTQYQDILNHHSWANRGDKNTVQNISCHHEANCQVGRLVRRPGGPPRHMLDVARSNDLPR